jgi:glycosyltransferase involved in cell wall biosynthesis
MNIVMMTNTYKPHVGGVANSVYSFKEELKRKGNKTLVVAPHFDNEEDEDDVIRVNAIRNFNGSDFSVSLPSPIIASEKLEDFMPDIIHSHHPFLLGSSALRLATFKNIPLVFTHHTLYERYTHYVPFDSENLQELTVNMVTEYCNLCSSVIAPSQSIKELLEKRGVKREIDVVPTGIDEHLFSIDRDDELEKKLGIPKDAFVIGHVSRLAKEKNQNFLCQAVATFLKKRENAFFVVVGDGDIKEELEEIFKKEGVENRAIFLGSKKGEELIKIYKRFDIFAFSSTSETQGMVIAEALLASTPIVALKASGVEELVQSHKNGILIEKESENSFIEAFETLYSLSKERLENLKKSSKRSAKEYTLSRTTQKLVEIYKKRTLEKRDFRSSDIDIFDKTLRVLGAEYNLWKGRAEAVKNSIK